MTAMLGRKATVDDTVAGHDTAEPDISGAAGDRSRRDPVPGRQSPIGRGPLDAGRLSPAPVSVAGGRGWRQRAACQGMDGSRFFGPERERATAEAARIAAAKRVCAGCAVVPDCRAFALQTGEPYGVWGGLSEYERADMLETSVRLNGSAQRGRPPQLTDPACVPVCPSVVNVHPAALAAR